MPKDTTNKVNARFRFLRCIFYGIYIGRLVVVFVGVFVGLIMIWISSKGA